MMARRTDAGTAEQARPAFGAEAEAGADRRASRCAIGPWLIGIVMVVLTLAGLAKAWDIAEFRAALLKWPGLSPDSARFISIAVPQAELVAGGCWILGVRRRAAAWAAAALLVAFSGALGAQLWWLGTLPPCNCFGRLLLLRTLSDQGVFALVRNGVLLGLLLTGLWFSRHDAR